jgi:hypothetical protein
MSIVAMDTLTNLRYFRIKFVYFCRNHPLSLVGRICVGAIVAIVFIFFWSHEKTYIFSISKMTWLKVLAYGIIPLGLSLVGAHYAVEVVKEKRAKTMARYAFYFAGVCCCVLILFIETKTDSDHKTEKDGLNQRLEAIQANGEKELAYLSKPQTPPPVRSNPEQAKRRILTLLTNEYITMHDPISADILSGKESPPIDWINKRLKELGQNWSVMSSGGPQPQILAPPNPQPAQPQNLAKPAIQVTAEMRSQRDAGLALGRQIISWADARLKEAPPDFPTAQTPEEQANAATFGTAIHREWQERFGSASSVLNQLELIERELGILVGVNRACQLERISGSGNHGFLETKKICGGEIQAAAQKIQ